MVVDEAKQQLVVAFAECLSVLRPQGMQWRVGIIGLSLVDDARDEPEGERRVNAVAAAVANSPPASPSAS